MKSKNTLITRSAIHKRIAELGQKISRDYTRKNLVVVGVLKGSFLFMADLVRVIERPVTCEFIRVSSYKGHRSTGQVRVEFDLTESIEGKHVLLVEDIVDTGNTLKFLMDHLKAKKPKSLKVCSLLYKEINPALKRHIHYLGFTISNHFVVGYGLDHDGLWRNLPEIQKIAPGKAK